MRRAIIALITLMVISVGFLSGCTQTESDIEATSSMNYVVSDTNTYRDTDRRIEQVYVEIQNFGDKDEVFTVDFEFALLDLDELGQQEPYGGGTTGESSIWDDTYHIQKSELVRAHDVKKICCTPQTQYDNKIPIEWDYNVE